MVTVQQHNHDDTIKKGYYCCSSFSSSQSSVISSTSVSSILHGFRHSYSVHPHISVHAMSLFLQLQFFRSLFYSYTLQGVLLPSVLENSTSIQEHNHRPLSSNHSFLEEAFVGNPPCYDAKPSPYMK